MAKKKKTKIGSLISKAKKAVSSYAKNVAGGAKIVASAIKNAPANNISKVSSSNKSAAKNVVTSTSVKTPSIKSIKKVAVNALPSSVKSKVNNTIQKYQANNGIISRIVGGIKNAGGYSAFAKSDASGDLADGYLFDKQGEIDSQRDKQTTPKIYEPQKSTLEQFNEDVRRGVEQKQAEKKAIKPAGMTLADGTGYIDENGNFVSNGQAGGMTIAPTQGMSINPDFSGGNSTVSQDVSAPVTEPLPTEEPTQPTETTESGLRTDFSSSPSTFNPASIANTNATASKFQMSLDNMSSNPWQYNSNPQESKQTLLNTFSSQFAQDYASPQEFYNILSTNPELQRSLKTYFDNGGTPAMIASKIVPVTNDIVPAQDTATYLDKIQAQTPEQMKAEQALTFEKQLAQQEIARQYAMSQDLQDLYFGTEDQKGILQQQMQMAKEQKKLIERKELMEERNLRAAAQYEIDKNIADAEIAKSEIELNRIQTKNYMMGRLASLGALITTGAAPMAMGVLEQKYQQQKQQLETRLTFANRDIQIKLTKAINDLEMERDEDIQRINEDISKSESDMRKEIFKAQKSADDKIYDITTSYASKLRSETNRFSTELRSISERYSDNVWKLMSSGGMSRSAAMGAVDSSTGTINMNKVPASVFAGKGTAGDRTANSLGMDSATYEYFKTLPASFRSKYTSAILTQKANGLNPKPSIASLNFYKNQPEFVEKGSDEDVGYALRDALSAINSGADRVAVKRQFLSDYPSKSAAFDNYIDE